MVAREGLDSSIRLHVSFLSIEMISTDVKGERTEKGVVDSASRFHSRVLTPSRSSSRQSS
jgi:hypothetical protein